MASSARETVERMYAAFGKGDLPGVFAALSPDVVWRFIGQPSQVPYGGDFKGVAGVQTFFEKLGGAVEILKFEPGEFIESGDKVVVLGHERGKGRATGKIYETDWVHVYHVKDGKVVRFHEFMDSGAIAAAVAK